MRHFSFRPTLSLSGRKFKGLRGWAGKPLHPPLTDIPIGAYMLAAVLDLISLVGRHQTWSFEFYQAATFVLIGGVAVAVFAALTGFWDWWRSSEAGTQARRTINSHAWIMIVATLVVLVDIGLRWLRYHGMHHTPPGIFVLTVIAAAITALGATYGGTMVFDYGFNVETAGDHPVWHKSETDVFPGQH
jgi:uncharacterized membrane protein